MDNVVIHRTNSSSSPSLLSQAKRRLLDKYLAAKQTDSRSQSVVRLRPDNTPIPLSFSQEQVWLHSQMAGEIPFYNETMTVYREGPLDVNVLQRCLAEIVRRHEIWRTIFDEVGGNPIQVVHPAPATFPLPVTDLRELPEVEREHEAERLATADARRPMDLKTGPLVRALLVRMDDERYRLYMTIHQIVFDAVTAYRVFVPELAALYQAFSNGQPPTLSEPSLQYADFAYTQRTTHNGFDRSLGYWRKQLAGELPTLEWPTDHPRPALESHRGAIERFSMPGDLVAVARNQSRHAGVSLYMTLVASLTALLHRYTGQEDIIIGSFSAGRKHAELERLLGYFVNPLALRCDVSGSPTFRQLQQRVRDVLLDTLAHDDVPFSQVVRAVQHKPDRSRNPLFQIVLSQQPRLGGTTPGWDLQTEEISNGGSKLDLVIVIDDRGDSIFGPITYNPDLFDADTIKRMVGHWQTLLAAACANPDEPIANLPLLTEDERHEILLEWNDTERADPSACVHKLIEDQASRTADSTAVVFADQGLTYRELNGRANQLARHLRNLGVGPEVLVGICMERSAEMLVALLAVMKAGGAYVPLDPSYPSERLAFMVEDSGLQVLLASGSSHESLGGFRGKLVRLDCDWTSIAQHSLDDFDSGVTPDNLVYVIYTSGSTGKPKGVQISHRALANLLYSMKEEPGLNEHGRLLAVTTISFDIAVLELYLPLITGACCVVASKEAAADGHQLSCQLEEHDISVMQATPSTWKLMLAAGWTGKQDLTILCGGEPMSRELAEELLTKAASVWNMYGPTETTVWSTVHRVGSGEGPVPIGKPIANTEVYLLDRKLQPVPVGIVGELHIGGAGVARGYLGRPSLTAERFIANPFVDKSGAILYKTGDLARYRPDGTIECLGRKDNQVKLRGFRIELDEIESVLREHPAIADGCVVVREDTPGDPRLVGYYVPATDCASQPADIRAFLKQRLPVYMIPVLVELHKLPLTPNGKLDRRALPTIEVVEPDSDNKSQTSDDPIERLLMSIWSDVLKIDQVGTYDNFFDLGGHSLLATHVVARIENELGLRIKAKELAFQTLGQLAESCRERVQCNAVA